MVQCIQNFERSCLERNRAKSQYSKTLDCFIFQHIKSPCKPVSQYTCYLPIHSRYSTGVLLRNLPKDTCELQLNLHTILLMLNVKQESCQNQLLKSFGLTWQGIEPRFPTAADALTATNEPLTNSVSAGSIRPVRELSPKETSKF